MAVKVLSRAWAIGEWLIWVVATVKLADHLRKEAQKGWPLAVALRQQRQLAYDP